MDKKDMLVIVITGFLVLSIGAFASINNNVAGEAFRFSGFMKGEKAEPSPSPTPTPPPCDDTCPADMIQMNPPDCSCKNSPAGGPGIHNPSRGK